MNEERRPKVGVGVFVQRDGALLMGRVTVTGLPAERLSRSTDPATSVAAAAKAAKASPVAIAAVLKAMLDRAPRIDEEIWKRCRTQGYLSTLSTIQHGRLALSESGVLVFTEVTRPTSNGLNSQEWIISSDAIYVQTVVGVYDSVDVGIRSRPRSRPKRSDDLSGVSALDIVRSLVQDRRLTATEQQAIAKILDAGTKMAKWFNQTQAKDR